MKCIKHRLIASALLLITAAAWAENHADKPMSVPPDQKREQVRQVDSDKEIEMIMLNQQLNKKGSKVDQTSHEMKSRHDTEQSIINNLK